MKDKNIASIFMIVLVFLFLSVFTVSAQVSEESFRAPGTVEGAGKHFEITDSEYLNIALESSENVMVRVESIPEMIVLDIKASESASSADFILSGFPANATFHKYQDGYENYAPLISDSNGIVYFEQNISQNHIIFIQPRKSTKIIKDDPVGGHCTSIGNWDVSTKTCTLNKNISETVQISNDNITLDGNGHSITGTNTGYGVYAVGNRDVIKNITVSGFTYGIYIGKNGSVISSTATSNTYGVYASGNSSLTGVNISGNQILKNKYYGIYLSSMKNNVISENIIGPENGVGVAQYSPAESSYEKNDIFNNKSGAVIYGNNNNLRGNVIHDNILSNFYLRSDDMATNNVGVDNTIDGKPIYYEKNISDKTYDSIDAGSFYCSNCENITLKNITLPKKEGQVFLWRTNNSSMEGLNSEDKSAKIFLSNSSGNVIRKNNFRSIHVFSSSNNNQIYNNNIIDTDRWSTAVYYSSNDNVFYLPLPIGGNYWGVNNKKCVDANGDKICDVAFGFDGGVDKFPLAKEFGSEPPCCSSVMFLPGHQASRLYRGDSGDEDRLWEPTNRNEDVEQLYMDANGESIDQNIYTRDIIDETYGGVNIYKGFIAFMDKMVSDGIINKWQYIPYDWRLSLEDIAKDGVKLENGETGSIIREIRTLAAVSKTGKVTLVGHSNGGLLGKTIIDELKKTGEEKLVDRLVMVATPQLGTPKAMAGLLHGDEINLLHGFLLDKETARGFAENMTSAFNLLPSKKYFDIVQSPVVEFDSDVTEIFDFPALYGDNIDNWTEFKKFLLGDNGGRADPEFGDTDSPNVLSQTLLNRADATHSALDSWQAPQGLEVIQIAGWGLDTIRGIRYDDCDFIFCPDNLSNLDRSLILTQDGDETVVVPSAVEMGEGADKYYVDIKEHNKELILNARRNRSHASILEIDSLRDFVGNIIQNNKNLTDHISIEKPEVKDEDKRLRFRLHSPVSLDVYDQDNNHTGLINNPDSDLRLVEEQIPNSYYLEFGETKYAGAGDYPVDIDLIGEGLGTFTFEIDQVAGEQVAKNTAFANIPVMKGMKAEVSVSETVGEMTIDFDNDGQKDVTLIPGEELDQADLLEIFQRMVYYLNIEETVKNRLINKIDNAKKQMEIGHVISANAMLENVKQQIETFSRENTPEKFTILEDDAKRLIEIINKIQAV